MGAANNSKLSPLKSPFQTQKTTKRHSRPSFFLTLVALAQDAAKPENGLLTEWRVSFPKITD
jgi:hypothetical protein